MKQRVVGDDNEMRTFATEYIAALASSASAATILTLSGELGAGKTTFTQAVARVLGVEDTVNSPTFVIQKIYALADQKWKHLVHIDAYRLKSADELKQLGWDELIADSGNLIMIEWPEHVADAIPESTHRIRIEMGQGDVRTIYYG